MRRGVIDGQVETQINYSLEIIGLVFFFFFFFCLVVALSVFADDACGRVDVNSKTSTTFLRAFRTGFYIWPKKCKRKTAKKRS